jgi:HPt (histidine-containing phosphotransfer) domain-containing protein
MDMNIKGFEDLCDGDAEALRELIQLYLTKTTEQMRQLKKGIEENSPVTVSRLAHAISGANLMVGIDSIALPLRQLERCSEAGDMAQAKIIFQEVEVQYKDLSLFLKEKI